MNKPVIVSMSAHEVLSDLNNQLEYLEEKGNVSSEGSVGCSTAGNNVEVERNTHSNTLCSLAAAPVTVHNGAIVSCPSKPSSGFAPLSPSPPTHPKPTTLVTSSLTSAQQAKHVISMRPGGKAADSEPTVGFTCNTNFRVVSTSLAPHPPQSGNPLHNPAQPPIMNSNGGSPQETFIESHASPPILGMEMPPLDFSHLGDRVVNSVASDAASSTQLHSARGGLGTQPQPPTDFIVASAGCCPFGVSGVPDGVTVGVYSTPNLPYGNAAGDQEHSSCHGNKEQNPCRETGLKTSPACSSLTSKKVVSALSGRGSSTSKLNTSHRSSATSTTISGQLTARKASGNSLGVVKKNSTLSGGVAAAKATTTSKSQSNTVGSTSTSSGSLTGRKLSSSFPSSNSSPVGHFQCRGTTGSSSGKVWSQAGLNSTNSTSSAGSRGGTARGGRISPASSDVHKLALHKEQRRREIYAWNEKLRKELEKGDVAVDAV